jgi:hypothetical protein
MTNDMFSSTQNGCWCMGTYKVVAVYICSDIILIYAVSVLIWRVSTCRTNNIKKGIVYTATNTHCLHNRFYCKHN